MYIMYIYTINVSFVMYENENKIQVKLFILVSLNFLFKRDIYMVKIIKNKSDNEYVIVNECTATNGI